MKIANIVSNTKERVSDDFNVVKSLGEITQGLPTLIVGWEYIKENYPKYNITKRKVGDIFWTFKITENRDLHDEDITKFSKGVYNTLVKDIRYHFLDVISHKKSTIKKFLMLVNSTKDIICYRHSDAIRKLDMVYMLINGTIYGIDLNLLEYLGISKDKVVDKIRKKAHVFLDENHIFIEYEKGLELLDYQVKYIPFLYSIKNG